MDLDFIDEGPESEPQWDPKYRPVTLQDLEAGRRPPGPTPSKYRCKGVYYLPPDEVVVPRFWTDVDRPVIDRHMSQGYGYPASLFINGRMKALTLPLNLTPNKFKAQIRQLYPRLKGPFSVLMVGVQRKMTELEGDQCSPRYLKTLGHRSRGYQGYLIIRDKKITSVDQGEAVILDAAIIKGEANWMPETQSPGQGEPVLLGDAQMNTQEDMTPEDSESLPACSPATSSSEFQEPLCYEGRMKVIASRFTPGQELRQSLLSLVRAHNLKAAYVLTCVGSLTKATLRLADSTTIATYNGPFEIVSLVGTLSGKAGHLHISLSDNKGLVIGGHVVGDLIIHTTAEVVIGECEGVKFEREKDRETGFHELAVYPGKS
ncbi:hypothetical protein ACOMHN_032978 [Nucella lapillus]